MNPIRKFFDILFEYYGPQKWWLCGKNYFPSKVSGGKRRTASYFMLSTSRFLSLMPIPEGSLNGIYILTELRITTLCKRFLWMLCRSMSPFTTNTTLSSSPSAKNPAASQDVQKFTKKSQIFREIFLEWTQKVHLAVLYYGKRKEILP